MKRIAILSISLLLLLSCNTNNRKDIYMKSTFQNIKINGKLKEILLDFIKENKCANCLNEVYFDKIDPHKTIITIKSRSPSREYLQRHNPLYYIDIDNHIIYVYSGLEDYINGDEKYFRKQKSDSNCSFIYWNVVDSFNNFTINKNGGPPYLPFPQKFKVISIDSAK